MKALIIGSSGAIGGALLDCLQADKRYQTVLGIHRSSTPAVDFNEEQSIALAALSLLPVGPFDLIICATGVLQNARCKPEKRLTQLSYEQMNEVFRINTFGPAMLIQSFSRLLAPAAKMAILSAKVGSIGDNRLGGWYSYRASKAALNMIVKTAAIEIGRSNPQAILMALHPGTVQSPLSEPFKGIEIGLQASVAASNLLNVIHTKNPQDTGGFFSYQNEALPW